MKASTKVFSILSLAAAIGKILSKSNNKTLSETQNDMMKWRGKKLHEAAFRATQKYPFQSLTDSKVQQIEKKVDQICKADDNFEIVETLSFLLCGLDEILEKTNSRNKEFLKPVVSRSLWCQEFFDPKLDFQDVYVSAYAKYLAWAA